MIYVYDMLYFLFYIDFCCRCNVVVVGYIVVVVCSSCVKQYSHSCLFCFTWTAVCCWNLPYCSCSIYCLFVHLYSLLILSWFSFIIIYLLLIYCWDC